MVTFQLAPEPGENDVTACTQSRPESIAPTRIAMSDYFLLEVYVHDLQFDVPVQQDERAPAPLALAFQFLDYPLLLTYARSPGAFGSESVIRFSAGKSCILQEEAEELQFVLQQVRTAHSAAKSTPLATCNTSHPMQHLCWAQVPLYASLFHVGTLPRPALIASGSTPLFISEPLQQSMGSGRPSTAPASSTMTPGLANAVLREVPLVDLSSGQVRRSELTLSIPGLRG